MTMYERSPNCSGKLGEHYGNIRLFMSRSKGTGYLRTKVFSKSWEMLMMKSPMRSREFSMSM